MMVPQTQSQSQSQSVQVPGMQEWTNKVVMLTYAWPTEQQYTMACQSMGNVGENAERAKNAEVDEKYKTELCKNWMQYGKCSYGHKCRFAHGKDDLINKQIYNPKYKSKKCEGFHTQLYCPYGSRCNFIHDDGQTCPRSTVLYAHLLRPSLKLAWLKHKLIRHLDFAQSPLAQARGFRPHDTLASIVRYLFCECFPRRLPVFQALVPDLDLDPNVPSAPDFLQTRLLAMMEDVFRVLRRDYESSKNSEEYKEVLSLFVEILLSLHPALKDCDHYGLSDQRDRFVRLLTHLYTQMFLNPNGSDLDHELPIPTPTAHPGCDESSADESYPEPMFSLDNIWKPN